MEKYYQLHLPPFLSHTPLSLSLYTMALTLLPYSQRLVLFIHPCLESASSHLFCMVTLPKLEPVL